MNLGLIGLLTALQTANPNPSVPYDSSRAAAEEVASYLMEKGQRELGFIQGNDSSEGYIRCWVKRAGHIDGALEFRLCKIYPPENPTHRSLWFLEFAFIRPNSTQLTVYDYGVTGHASMCKEIPEQPETPAYKAKCENVYQMLISSFRNFFLKKN